MKKKETTHYEAPECTIMPLCFEKIICASVTVMENEDYSNEDVYTW